MWRESDLFMSLREPQSAGACASCGSYDACQGGCMAAKFFTGIPLDGPDPECVFGHGEEALAARDATALPGAAIGHSKVDVHGRPSRCPPGPFPDVSPRLARAVASTWSSAARPGLLSLHGRERLLALPIGSLEQHGPTCRSTRTPVSQSSWGSVSRRPGATSWWRRPVAVRRQWRARRVPGDLAGQPRGLGRPPARADPFGPNSFLGVSSFPPMEGTSRRCRWSESAAGPMERPR